MSGCLARILESARYAPTRGGGVAEDIVGVGVEDRHADRWPAVLQVDGEDDVDAPPACVPRVHHEPPASFAPDVGGGSGRDLTRVLAPMGAGVQGGHGPPDRHPAQLTRLGVAQPYHDLAELG